VAYTFSEKDKLRQELVKEVIIVFIESSIYIFVEVKKVWGDPCKNECLNFVKKENYHFSNGQLSLYCNDPG
jgi:hypothetical protein